VESLQAAAGAQFAVADRAGQFGDLRQHLFGAAEFAAYDRGLGVVLVLAVA
jgi:hypothetical protein